MTRRSLTLLVLALAGAGAATWWWTSQQRAAAPAAPGAPAANRGAAPQAVTVSPVVQRDVPVVLEAAGTVVSLNSVDIRPQVSTTVRSVAIQEGQAVARGQLLFSFDDRADRANLDRARAQLARDRATLADLQ
ncbi:MAG: hypothetical protein RL722_1549, partial [Pseudomonadota bacterium]